MARTTEEFVKAILGKDYDTSPRGNRSLAPYIESASILVDKVAAEANAGTARELEMVERWLAAHIYCMMDKTFTSRSNAGGSASFAGSTDKGFEATLYGQTAMRIDSTGFLYRLDGHRYASLFWAGQTESEQLNYEERN